MKRLAGIGLAVVLLSGCAVKLGTEKALLVTGETLLGIADQFVAVASVYKHGCDVARTFPADKCAKFREFGDRFKETYPFTVRLWDAARVANDKAAEEGAAAVIRQLSSDLSVLAVQAMETFGGKN